MGTQWQNPYQPVAFKKKKKKKNLSMREFDLIIQGVSGRGQN